MSASHLVNKHPKSWSSFPLLAAVLLVQAACMSTKAPERTATMDAFGVDDDLNARRVRLSAQNLANLYMSTVELTADSIAKLSGEPAIPW